MIAQLIKFAIGGGIGTVCHYSLLMAMVNRGVTPVSASGCGMILGAAVVYLVNYYLTFSSPKKHFDALKRFLPMAGVGLCLNTLLLGCFLNYFSLPLPLSQVAATSGQFMFGFFVSRLWVF